MIQAIATPYADVKNPFSVNEKGATVDYMLTDPETAHDIVLGSSLLIKDKREGKDVWIVATAVELSTVLPFEIERENRLYIDDDADPTKLLTETTGPHTIQRMIIRVRLEHEMTRASTAERRFTYSPVQKPPSSSSYLFFPTVLPDAASVDPSLHDMLNIKSSGLDIGAVGFGNTPYQKDDQFLIYKWAINDLDNKHIFIVGESGSGKTVFLKNLALQIRSDDNKARIIMTDVQGDISQLLLPDLINVPPLNPWQEKIKLKTAEESITALKPFQLVIPVSSDKAKQDNVNALKKLAEKRGVLVKEIGLRLQDLPNPSDVEYLFRVASEQVAVLLDEEAETLDANSKPHTLEALRAVITRALTTNRGESQIMSSGGTPYYSSTYNAALRALKTLSLYFDFDQASMSAAENPLDCFKFSGTTIFFLEYLDYDERIMWEMQLVRWLYNKKRELGNTFVFFDEAHQIIPAKPPGAGSRGTFDRLRRNFEGLSREGRKFGINLVLSTQSPRDLHEIVPEQCPTRIVMKIDPRNADAALLAKDLAFMANKFGKGQFWLISPFNDTPNWIKIHSWVPNLPHETMAQFWDKIREKARIET